MWYWLTQTDSGLMARIAVGATIFACLALLDLHQNRSQATRWREYSFLLGCVAAALLYGIANDLITSSISWEYYYYGKGLADELHELPPDAIRLKLAAAMIGIKATWSAGLLIGVALLVANNPSRLRPRATYPMLGRSLLIVAAAAVTCAVAFGVAGFLGLPARFSNDFHQMLVRDEMRPRRFMAVFGVHLGGYVGGLLGTALAVWRIVRVRRGLGAPELSNRVN